MINNENLIHFLEIILNKNKKDIDVSDLKSLKTIIFSKLNKDNNQVYNSEELLLFENVEQITIKESTITNEDIEVLKKLPKLKKIIFSKCFFKDSSILTGLININDISFIECYNKDYNFINSLNKLEKLQIVNPYLDEKINVNSLFLSFGLKDITLQSCNLINIQSLSSMNNLEKLSLLFSKFEGDLNFIKNLNSLRELYISEDYIKAGKYGDLNVYNSYAHLLMIDESKSNIVL